MPKNYSLLFLLFTWVNLQAQIQPPGFEWAKSFGGWEDDYLTDMGADDEGNVYVCGEFKDFICFDTHCLFSQIEDTTDIFLAKYDSLGNVVWAKAFGGRWTDEDAEMEVSPEGDIYLSGKFSDSIRIGTEVLHANDPNFYLYGAPDCFIAKLNTDGEVQWVIHPGTSHVFDIKLKNNELYVSGTLSEIFLEFGESRIWRNSNREDTYLVKLDADGQVIWSKTFGIIGNKSSLISSIAVSEDEKVFISGRSIDTLLIDTLMITYESKPLEFIVGLDENGRSLWGEYFIEDSNLSSFSLKEIEVVGKNMLMGVGYLRGKIVWGESIYRSREYRYFNLGINFKGKSKWLKAYPGQLSISQSTTLNNQLYVCGTLSSSIYFDDTTIWVSRNGISETVVLRHDSTGKLVWGKSLPSPAQDDGLGIAHTSNGNIYVAGGFYDYSTLIDSLVVSSSLCCRLELWVGRMSRDSFLKPVIPPDLIPIEWKVFPNPFVDSLFLRGKFDTPLQLTLYDLQGRLVWESSIQTPTSPTQIPISVPELSPALYILVLKTKHQLVAYKLLKQP